MEVIDIVHPPPDWKCLVNVIIGKSAEEAKERERNNEADVRIYMDGLGYRGEIGAAAVLYRGMERVKVMRKQLGPETKHTVFEGECVGQVLGFELLKRELRGQRKIQTVTMGTDNQAGIRAVGAPGKGLARYFVDRVLEGISKVKAIEPRVEITIYWTPGHEGLPGNK